MSFEHYAKAETLGSKPAIPACSITIVIGRQLRSIRSVDHHTHRAARSERLKLLLKLLFKYRGGFIFSALGTALLAAVLQRSLDFSEPGDLFKSAFVAAIAGAFLLVASAAILGLAAAMGSGIRWKFVRLYVIVISAPIGVAFSLALSFLGGALYVMLIPESWQVVVTIVGLGMLTGGCMLTSQFWRDVWTWVKTLPSFPVPSPGTPSP